MPALFSIASQQLPARAPAGFGLAAALLLPVMFWLTPALAADGRFEVINASGRLEASGWLVDARVDLELSKEALRALQSGVTLRIAFQHEVSKRRRFWPDAVIETRQQAFEVHYLSLSQRYVVRNVNEQTVNSYATLFSALRYLGEVRDFVIIGDELGSKLQRYEFALRAVLDWEKLPGPLAMLTFWRGDFSLESDWYRWTPKE